MRAICNIALLTCIHISVAQNSIDSLHQLLSNKPKDSAYVDILNELSFQYLLQKPSLALPFINQAIALSDSLDHKTGYFRAITNKGSAYWTSGLPDLALKYYLQARSNEVPNNAIPNAALQNNIGEVFKKKGQYDSAIKYYRLGILKALGNIPKSIPVMLYYNLGEAYLLMNQIDSAKKYFQMSFDSASLKNHNRGLSYSLAGLSELARKQGNSELAIKYQKDALSIRKRINDTRGIIQSYHKISSIYEIQSELNYTKIYLDSALNMAVNNKTYDLLSETYRLISTVFELKGDYKSSLEYSNKHHTLNDSISNHVFVENIDQMKAALLGEIQSIENRLLIEKNRKLESESQAQLIIIICISALLIMIGVFLYLNKQRKIAIQTTSSNRRIIETLQRISYFGSSRSFNDFMHELLEVCAKTLGANRASFWSYSTIENTIEVSNHYTESGQFQTLGTKVSIGFFKDYFDLLHRETIIVVDNTNSTELAVEYDKDYIRSFNIKALIDVEIRSEDAFIGILSFENTDRIRKWSYSDQRFASSLSNIISSAYLLNENRNLLLELLQKNRQLRDSGFALSHDLREPLSQILGFTELMIRDSSIENKEIWKRLEAASKKMDNVIKRLATELANDDFV